MAPSTFELPPYPDGAGACSKVYLSPKPNGGRFLRGLTQSANHACVAQTTAPQSWPTVSESLTAFDARARTRTPTATHQPLTLSREPRGTAREYLKGSYVSLTTTYSCNAVLRH